MLQRMMEQYRLSMPAKNLRFFGSLTTRDSHVRWNIETPSLSLFLYPPPEREKHNEVEN